MEDWLVSITANGGPVEGDSVQLSTELVHVLQDLGGGAPAVGVSATRVDASFIVDAPEFRTAVDMGIDLWSTALTKWGRPFPEVVRSEIASLAEVEARLEGMAFPSLLGLAEVAEALDVGKSRVSALREEPWFPRPVADLASGPVWSTAGIEKFNREWDRTSGRRKSVGKSSDFGLEAMA